MTLEESVQHVVMTAIQEVSEPIMLILGSLYFAIIPALSHGKFTIEEIRISARLDGVPKKPTSDCYFRTNLSRKSITSALGNALVFSYNLLFH